MITLIFSKPAVDFRLLMAPLIADDFRASALQLMILIFADISFDADARRRRRRRFHADAAKLILFRQFAQLSPYADTPPPAPLRAFCAADFTLPLAID
jgi:hypothetical protein